MMDITTFASLWTREYQTSRRGNALGVQVLRDEAPHIYHYDAACAAFNLRSCMEFEYYFNIGGTGSAQTYVPLQMQRIVDDPVPSVFFVPPKLMTHPDAHMTRAEMQWFLAAPDRARNSYFVLGLYDLQPDPRFVDQTLEPFGIGLQYALIETLQGLVV